ncbi:putative bifunctional diguanylate cyclase/phosphodiesterase [Rhodococcus erythropolis]|uniref:putative bifunctional diguanylate cyclase/phosphodiesterase n=1 Tax=Rhodococcus erythropolis TaxID=1833 RepID=UPI000AC8CA3E|nr:EAL domain-containing protein [Rhodococcus erythropolis]MCD2156611.1 EAL domain-containing protein [Rhodococcus cerastii]MCS4256874.1 diguanylate cyclase (GGDEF)-like protein [Rhodococcus erythropolis]MCW2425903.1 diguanylate cyclase (GGDEF)-like protein [Rhodococcus erythropolis]
MDDPAVLRRRRVETSVRKLGRSGTEQHLSDYDRRRLLDRRLRFTARVLPWSFLTAAVALSAIVVLLPVDAGWFSFAWSSVMLLSSAGFSVYWLRRSRMGVSESQTTELVVLTVEIIVWGVLLACLALVLFPMLDPGDELVLSSTLIGGIAVGVFPTMMFRGITVVWISLVGVGLAGAFWTEPGTSRFVLIGVLVIFVGSLYSGTLLLANLFERRLRAELVAEDERDLVELLLNDLEDGAQDWLWETDSRGIASTVSYRFAEQVGLPAAQIRGRTMHEILIGIGASRTDAGRKSLDLLTANFQAGTAFRDLTMQVVVRGDTRWWSMSGHPGSGDGADYGWRGVGSDITHSYHQRQNILRLAEVDSLTGLRNRYSFNSQLSSRLRDGRRVWLAILDLDNFKSINDRLGHHVGDDVLRDVASRLHSVLRSNEICGRLGGDEFAIAFDDSAFDDSAFDDIASADEVEERFQTILDSFERPFSLVGNQIRIRASLGYGSMPDDADSLEDLVIVADLALYHAKESGRNQIRAFDATLRDRATGRARALLDLRRALIDEEFELVYQPQVSAATGVVVGFEALLRWNHPTSGLVSPGDFISVAEETGLIVPIGAGVLRAACTAATTWPEDIRVAVNVSQVQLRSSRYVESVRQTLNEVNLHPSRLEIEVTESLVIDDADRDVLVQLSALGIAIAMDDFGTGFSSVASLARLPLDRLKIDRAFVAPLDADPSNSRFAVLRAVIAIAKSLGLDTVAEGVETERQRAIVTECGCDVIQGYLEGMPIRAAEIPDYLNERPGGPSRLGVAATTE